MTLSTVGYFASVAFVVLAHMLGDSIFIYAIAMVIALGNIALAVEDIRDRR